MNAQEGWPERLTRSIAGHIRQHRKARKWSAQRLSDECAELGLEIPRTIIADLENGRRRQISIAELLVLAHALEVAPAALLIPVDGDESLEVLPGQVLPALDVARWFGVVNVDAMYRCGHDGQLAAVRRKVAELARLIGNAEKER